MRSEDTPEGTRRDRPAVPGPGQMPIAEEPGTTHFIKTYVGPIPYGAVYLSLQRVGGLSGTTSPLSTSVHGKLIGLG